VTLLEACYEFLTMAPMISIQKNTTVTEFQGITGLEVFLRMISRYYLPPPPPPPPAEGPAKNLSHPPALLKRDAKRDV
jgi:hypothetical protein